MKLLVERVAAAYWKFRRAAAFENGALGATRAAERGVGKVAWTGAQQGPPVCLATTDSRRERDAHAAALHELERPQCPPAVPAVPPPP